MRHNVADMKHRTLILSPLYWSALIHSTVKHNFRECIDLLQTPYSSGKDFSIWLSLGEPRKEPCKWLR